MQRDPLDFHLDQARRHVDIAMRRTRQLIGDREPEQALADKWSRFLSHLFGQSWS